MKYLILPPVLVLGLWLALPDARHEALSAVAIDWDPLGLGEPEIHVEHQIDAVLARIAYREAIVARLIGGRLSLLEAAERFRELNRAENDCHRLLPGQSEQERLCRQVILWVGQHSPAFACQLEGELAELLRGESVEDAD